MGFFQIRVERGRAVWADLVIMAMVLVAAVMVLATSAMPVRAATGADASDYPPGTIVISQSRRRLFLVEGGGASISYPVAVGRIGKQWLGTVRIDGKYVNPAWAPPAEVKRAEPWLPNYIPGGSPHNPMGARALTLSGDEYAIHGTNRPDSIGKAASYGCIRMSNRDIVDLYARVAVGTPVVMLP